MKFLTKVAIIAAALLPANVAAQSGKPVVAVYQMDDLANTGEAETFSAMIETAIAQSGKFRVMERSRMAELLSEQGKAKTGLVASNDPNRIGGFEGVDYLIYGAITSVSVVEKQNIGATLVGGLLSSGRGKSCGNAIATLSADIKITDAATGEVRYVTSINQEEKSNSSCDGNARVDSSALLRGAAESIATGLVTSIYPIQVAAVQPDGTMILNYGSGSLSPGQVLRLYQKGEPIRDPATGEILASNDVELGLIEVSDVTPKISRARALTEFEFLPPVGSVAQVLSSEETESLKGSGRKRRR